MIAVPKPLGAIAGALALLASGCVSTAESDQPRDVRREHTITGTVMRTLEGSRLTLAHDAIPDAMPAMVMDFTADRLPDVHAGDHIRATLVTIGSQSTLTNVEVVAPGDGRGPAWPAAAAPGALIPDVPLRTQGDAPLRIRDLGGRVVIVTFIYTRCPMPEFCPRLMANLREMRRALAARPDLQSKVHMLAVTIDPTFDTPAILREYGKAQLGPNPFARLDLVTGDPRDIAVLASFFGLAYRPDGNLIAHSMVIGIVGSDGRLVKQFPDMTWNVDEALTVVSREARRGA